MEIGLVYTLIGAGLAIGLAGMGSAIGVALSGRAAAGVVSEKPELFGKVLILQALPGTQGIYGFLIAILVMVKVGMLGGNPANVSIAQGLGLFAACLPIAIVGLVSGIYQGKMAASAIAMTAKKPNMSARGMTMTAIVETYAILAFLISILMYNAIVI
ncbi:V-type ATP synthase subunit K [Haploplasma axanthum]|uniref:Sodium ATPase proteolipid component n=1 Tax=Haploplasma axanthum TaxID=29552 RepID=A0A449BCJ2_HAPAX|nr:V-type ATP synthase subunit K [Haploplasma axanthum]VEU80169.1 Sodium ATPase proteolipid component [Haploplasma axanthum]